MFGYYNFPLAALTVSPASSFFSYPGHAWGTRSSLDSSELTCKVIFGYPAVEVKLVTSESVFYLSFTQTIATICKKKKKKSCGLLGI